MKRILIIIIIITIAVTGFFTFLYSDKQLDQSATINKIVVEKSKRRLHLYFNDKLIKTYKISLGSHPVGDKTCEGDKRTPEGHYVINDKNPNSGYHKNLGISYPNKQDIKQAKKSCKSSGGQIKIHGIKNGFGWIGRLHLLIDWTAGCIALTNKEIDELYEAIHIGTPIEIKP
ncbi:MAG: L,D-transpeptidase family protein [Calditrichaceae bacterium]|nr:L,D-transpeptidase family protein [Calditrichaceae bacterium]MBN2709467.1 L,D-transpeptidase family protein [Calditrichaceae bacterium]